MASAYSFKRKAVSKVGLVALGAAVLISTTSCVAGNPESPSASPAATASTCVTHPSATIAAKPGAKSLTADLPPSLTTKLDNAAQSAFAIAAAPGAIVGVRTPQGTWTSAYGLADPVTKTPMTTNLHTRIGSVTKIFTVTVLLQLAQDGDLSLDDTISKYVSGIPNGDSITLRQLSDMTSGVASYSRDQKLLSSYFAHPETIYTPQELIKAGVAASPLFAPGTDFDYSNTNIALLGLVIEKVTGHPFEQVLAHKLLAPLDLANTTWPGDSPDMPTPYADGYTLQGDTATPSSPANATNWNPSFGYTSGELISNLDDMLVFARAVGTGQGLLDTVTQTERLTSFSATTGYGIGMVCNHGWVGHTGTVPGYDTTVYYDTRSDTSVVVLVNSDVLSGACESSPTLLEDPGTATCLGPAVRIFEAISTVLGNPFVPKPAK